MFFCLKFNVVLVLLEKRGKNKIDILYFFCEIFIYIYVEILYMNFFKLFYVGYCVGY